MVPYSDIRSQDNVDSFGVIWTMANKSYETYLNKYTHSPIDKLVAKC
jgi:hypothetical protein